MNYVSALYGVLGVIMLVDWFVRARQSYRGQSDEPKEEVGRKAALAAVMAHGHE